MKPRRKRTKAPAAKPRRATAGEPFLGPQDLHLFNEGTHENLYDKMGGRLLPKGGAHFAVWAPDAVKVSVIGDFNYWKNSADVLTGSSSGVWTGEVPKARKGDAYKFHIVSRDGSSEDKADPYALYSEVAPKTASRLWDLDYAWRDSDWLKVRGAKQALDAPQAIYEVHLGSWLRSPQDPEELRSYREITPKLVEYVTEMGFTHVELLPLMEHPFYGSWGYQTTGYFAPTSRHGIPQDFMFLIDSLHQAGIGVILDWVPSHFPTDAHSLGRFDGTALYEHADRRQGFHPDWDTYIFNYGRNEVRAFLISSAMMWLDKYHADGIRVDAVASMLYLDYSRKEGEWIPNKHGGRENLEAIDFLRQFNAAVYARYPDIQTFAEESTSWPMVSRPTHLGGLGFGYKWDMGWMNDTLGFFQKDPVHRRHHHHEITFRMIYAFNENFVLPLSHDEVVHGKGTLLRQMPGDDWQRFANLRALYGYMYGMPGKKLLFQGDEFAQLEEWQHDKSLDWHLREKPEHEGVRKMVADLNSLYSREPALHQGDCRENGFSWVDANDAHNSVLSFLRLAEDGGAVLIIANLTPVPRQNYRVGASRGGFWHEIFNSDEKNYGGSGMGNSGLVEAKAFPFHGRTHSLELTLPPLAVLYLRSEWKA
jgi:1,4-alpha-glucan branching enzyme